MALKHFNHKYSGGSPDIPLNIGDSYFAQDMARDFWFMRDQIGKAVVGLISDLGAGVLLKQVSVSFPSSGQVSVGVGFGYCKHDIKVPDSPWTVPPPVASENAIVRISWDAITGYSGWTGSPTLDGTTLNYIKLRYAESDGATRTRTKKGGNYSYEITPSWSMVINATPPTEYDVLVGVFLGTAVDSTAKIYPVGAANLGLVALSISADTYISFPGSYVVASPCSVFLNKNMPIKSKVSLYAESAFVIKQLEAGEMISYLGDHCTTPGPSGLISVLQGESLEITAGGTEGGNALINGSIYTLDAANITTNNWLSWSPDGRYLAVGFTASSSPFFAVYDFSSGSPVAVPIDTQPNDDIRSFAWSPDGTMLAGACPTSPYAYIYKVNPNGFTKMADPSTLPAGSSTGVDWSPSGRYLAFAHGSSPFVTIYDWSTGVPVKISDPSTLPGTTGNQVKWSNSGRYLAVTSAGTPFIQIYDFVTGAPVKLANPAALPPNSGGIPGWSPDDKYLVVPHATANYITIYSWVTGAPVKAADPGSLPAFTGVQAGWTSDGKYLMFTFADTVDLKLYSFWQGYAVSVSIPSGMPSGRITNFSIAPNMRRIAYASSAAPFCRISEQSALTKRWYVTRVEAQNHILGVTESFKRRIY